MTRANLMLVLAACFGVGCLNQLVPAYPAVGTDSQPPGSEVGGVPIYDYDMGTAYAPDPVGASGAPVHYSDIQAKFDSLGCTAAGCHGDVQVPVLVPTPKANQALLNYFDLLSGCADGAPDPSDCINTTNPGNSLLLAKVCATSGVMHMGGSPFPNASDPTYVQWKGWIAAGAPY